MRFQVKLNLISFLLILLIGSSSAANCSDWQAGVANFKSGCLSSPFACQVIPEIVYSSMSIRTGVNGTYMGYYCVATCDGAPPWTTSSYGIPKNCGPENDEENDGPDFPTCQSGSVVHIETQVLGETMPLVGSSFTLNYFTKWNEAYTPIYKLNTRLTGDPVRSDITSIDLTVKSGATTVYSNNYTSLSANQKVDWTWDGLNTSSVRTLGPQVFQVQVAENSNAGLDFTYDSEVTLGSLKADLLGLGGLVPSNWHYYDLNTKKHIRGDGTERTVTGVDIGGGEIRLAEEDGSQVYIFDSSTGKIKYILAPLTGQTLVTFVYNGSGQLWKIQEPFSKETIFNRNVSGDWISVEAPYGETSTVTLDTNDRLLTLTDPRGKVYELTYGTNDLIATFEKPNGGVSTFTYDADGNLTADVHSSGKEINLSRTDLGSNHYQISSESALGRERLIEYESTDQGQNYQQKITYPSGTIEVKYTNKVSSNHSQNTTTNGTASNSSYQLDNRLVGARRLTSLTDNLNASAKYIYQSHSASFGSDPFDAVSISSTRTHNSAEETIDYDGSTKTFSYESKLGKTSTRKIDQYERTIETKIGNQNSTTYTYTDDKLTSVEQGTRETTYAYISTSPMVQTITNPLGYDTDFQYDNNYNITKITLHDSREINYTYDDNGNIASITPPGRPAHSFDFLLDDLISEYTPPTLSGVSNPETTYQYNFDRQLTKVIRPDGEFIENTYDFTTGNLTGIATDSGYSQTLGYYQGFLNSITDSRSYGASIYYSYNEPYYHYHYGPSYYYYHYIGGSGGLKTYEADNFQTIYFTYNDDEDLTGAGNMTYAYSYPNGHMVSADLDTLEPEFTHNNYGELSEYKIETTTPSTYHYKLNLTYNDGGQITEKIEQLPGLSANTYEYTYDSSGRLTSVDKNSTNISSYTYSNNSNRTSGTFGGATTAYTYDNQDRLLTSGVWSYVYNDNGDLVSKTNSITTEVWTYTYDEFGSLRQVVTPTDTITYETDVFHRRVKKLVNSTLVVQYGYDIYGRLLAEMDSSGNQIRRYVYGSKQHTPDYFIQNSIDYLMVTDHLGSLRAAIKASDGTILKTMEHDEFGRVIGDSSPGTVAFGFAGGLYDHDTGLVRFGARDYDAEIGRWTSKDPILFNGGDTNLYGYVLNDPVNFIDPNGESRAAATLFIAGIGLYLISSDITQINEVRDYLKKKFDEHIRDPLKRFFDPEPQRQPSGFPDPQPDSQDVCRSCPCN